MYIEYRNIADMNDRIIRNLHKFPHDVDLIVGIPRSGMLPANLLALYLNKPYTDIDSYVDDGRVYVSGDRAKYFTAHNSGKVLVVDDSYSQGFALEKARKKLEAISKQGVQLIYGVIFTTTAGTQPGALDIWCEVIDTRRVFQWNLFHHAHFIPRSAFDIDGVLCEDPPVDDDGPIYTEYIRNAPAKFLPMLPVDLVVSCRLEKYRAVTEQWLAEHGVKYNKLILLDMPDRETRRRWGKHGQYKGEVYKQSDCKLFIESSLRQAKQMMKVTSKPIFCTETMEMMQRAEAYHRCATRLTGSLRNLGRAIRRKFNNKPGEGE